MLALAAMPSMTAAAQTGPVHDWADDIEGSTETANAYVCVQCGAERYEDISSIREYVVTLDANGGGVETERLETRRRKIRKLPIPYHSSDYQWEGWYTEPEGGEPVTEKWVYDHDTTLYAHWSIIGTRTLVFAVDGGSYIWPITRPYGTTLSLDGYVPAKEGYIFKGWYADPRTKQERVASFTFLESDVVYAKWEATAHAPDVLMYTDPIYLTDGQIAERIARRDALIAKRLDRN